MPSRRTAGNLADEQVMAANVDVAFLVAGLDGDFNLRRLERYLAVAWSSGVTPVVVLNKADVARDLEGRLVAVEAVAPGVPIVVLSALTGDHVARPRARTWGRAARRSSSARRASASRRSSTRCSARSARRRPRSATTTRAVATRRPTASCSRCPGGALLIDTPGIRSLEVAGADEGVETAFDDIAELAVPCRFSDCRHDGEPGCAVRAALADGTLDRGPPGEPPEARARARLRRAQGGPAGARGGGHVAGSRSTRPSHATWSTSTGEER